MQDSKRHSEDCHDRMQTPAGASRLCSAPGCPRGSFREAVWLVGNLAQVSTGYQMKIALQSGNYGGHTLHCFKSGVPAEAVRSIPTEKLSTLHLNDCEDLRREVLNHGHRLYPRLVAIPFGDVLGGIKANGYQGFFSVEAFGRSTGNRVQMGSPLIQRNTLNPDSENL